MFTANGEPAGPGRRSRFENKYESQAVNGTSLLASFYMFKIHLLFAYKGKSKLLSFAQLLANHYNCERKTKLLGGELFTKMHCTLEISGG